MLFYIFVIVNKSNENTKTTNVCVCLSVALIYGTEEQAVYQACDTQAIHVSMVNLFLVLVF